MADLCVFCGQKLPRLGRKELLCCGILQPTCKECYYKIMELPQEERGQRALNSGRAVEPEAIHKFLEDRQAAIEKARQSKLVPNTYCMRCREKGQFSCMLRIGKKKFQLGQETFFGSDWDHIMAGALELELLQCENCGFVEFYGAVEPKPDAPAPDTCPTCGSQYPKGEKCPRCAMNKAQGSSTITQAKAAKSEKKPPWEK